MWTVFFMRKALKQVVLCLLMVVFVFLGTLLADRQKLREELIRIHVVANSDAAEDQDIKFRIRDAVMESIRSDLENLSDVSEAKRYLRENLPRIQQTAMMALEKLGCKDTVTVFLGQEAFTAKANSLFALPAGIYESLRISIGSGQGENWWTVIFPGDYGTEEDTRAEMVFGSEQLKDRNSGGYEIRFYLLDMLGRLENIFFGG